MMREVQTNSRERIITAAIEVFAEKGKHGARMEEIGTRAQVNKAMVYYYYSSKKNLFREVVVSILRQIFGCVHDTLGQVAAGSADPVEQLRAAVSAHFDAIAHNPNLARVFFEAIADDPDDVRHAFQVIRQESDVYLPEKLLAIFDEGVRQGVFRSVDPKQILISIMGMNLAYFVGAPIARAVLDLPIRDERTFHEERKRSILDLLLRGIVQEGKP
jgi:TetR/AcrR family transcriptional regulator